MPCGFGAKLRARRLIARAASSRVAYQPHPTAASIAASNNTFLYLDYGAVNGQNGQSAIIQLLFPPPA